MDGKDIELSNKIDEFIAKFKQNNPHIKGNIYLNNSMEFCVEYDFNIDTTIQQQELELIKNSYFEYFKNELKNETLVKINMNKYPDIQKADFYYTYKTNLD